MSVTLYTTLGAVCDQCTCDEVVCDAVGDSLALPDTLVLLDDGQQARFREENRVLADGSIVDTPAWTKRRDLALTGFVASATAAAQDILLRQIRGMAIKQNLKLTDSVYGDGRFVNIGAPKKLPALHQEMWNKALTQVDLAWDLADPYWYSATSSSVSQAMTGNGTITVDTGSDPNVWMPAVIVLEAPASGSLASATLASATDSGRSWTYSGDAGLLDGAVVTVSGVDASVTRSGSSTIQYFSGAWWALMPGVNTINYTGGPCTVTIAWRARWI